MPGPFFNPSPSLLLCLPLGLTISCVSLSPYLIPLSPHLLNSLYVFLTISFVNRPPLRYKVLSPYLPCLPSPLSLCLPILSSPKQVKVSGGTRYPCLLRHHRLQATANTHHTGTRLEVQKENLKIQRNMRKEFRNVFLFSIVRPIKPQQMSYVIYLPHLNLYM